VKYVHCVRAPNGRKRLYLRRAGCPRIRLPDGLPAEALKRHVDELIQRHLGAPALDGSLRAALRAYELENPAFRALADSTKYEYRLILKELEADLGGVAVRDFTPAYVHRLMTLWARRGHRAANVRLQILKNVLRPCLVSGGLKVDPFPMIRNAPRPRALAEPHLLWPQPVFLAVVEQAIDRNRFGLARAVAIARYTGLRRGDLVRLADDALQNGRLVIETGKRRVTVDLPVDPALTVWLERIPSVPAPHPLRTRPAPAVRPTALIFNMAGQPYSEDGLGQELVKFVEALHREGLVDSPRYDLHGLRHTRGVELALAGCSDAEGAAMLGHRSASSFARYRRQAERVRLTDRAAARLEAFRSGGGLL
jgi:integrase